MSFILCSKPLNEVGIEHFFYWRSQVGGVMGKIQILFSKQLLKTHSILWSLIVDNLQTTDISFVADDYHKVQDIQYHFSKYKQTQLLFRSTKERHYLKYITSDISVRESWF